jgi:hypothetical protein
MHVSINKWRTEENRREQKRTEENRRKSEAEKKMFEFVGWLRYELELHFRKFLEFAESHNCWVYQNERSRFRFVFVET